MQDLISKEDYASILKGIELIRKKEMSNRTDLSEVVSFTIDNYGQNLDITCSNGKHFLLAISYLEYFYEDRQFARTFKIPLSELRSS